MRKLFPITLAILSIFLFSVVPADKAEATALDYFNDAVNELTTFGNSLDSFLANNLPFLASTGDVMGTAILKTGHFEVGSGIGVVAATGADEIFNGLTIIDTSEIDIPNTLPLPNLVAFGKMGLIKKLDVGVKLGTFPEVDVGDMSFSNLVWGVEARYGLIKGKLGSPRVSVGLSVEGISGEIVFTSTDTFNSLFNGTPATFVTNAIIMTEWNLTSVTLEARVSQKFILITPFASVSIAFNSGDVETTSSGSATATTTTPVDVFIGSYSITADQTRQEPDSTSYRAAAGLDLNFPAFRIGLEFDYDFTAEAYAGGIAFKAGF